MQVGPQSHFITSVTIADIGYEHFQDISLQLNLVC